MREYEESKRAAKRAARFQRDLEIAEAEAAAAGLPGLNRWAAEPEAPVTYPSRKCLSKTRDSKAAEAEATAASFPGLKGGHLNPSILMAGHAFVVLKGIEAEAAAGAFWLRKAGRDLAVAKPKIVDSSFPRSNKWAFKTVNVNIGCCGWALQSYICVIRNQKQQRLIAAASVGLPKWIIKCRFPKGHIGSKMDMKGMNKGADACGGAAHMLALILKHRGNHHRKNNSPALSITLGFCVSANRFCRPTAALMSMTCGSRLRAIVNVAIMLPHPCLRYVDYASGQSGKQFLCLVCDFGR
eukprot:1146279-Pelagomonas_calceolata.AAC.12